MMSRKRLEDRDVFPGEKLAVIEVLQSGYGTYHLDGQVRSSELGIAKFDLKDRRVDVERKTRELILPREDLDTVAEVGSVMRRDARVDIFIIDGKMITPPYIGVIHISNVAVDYVKDMTMAVRNGDIVKAKIVNTKNRIIQLSIKSPEYGVIYAFCSKCGTLMEQRRRRLHCPKCDRVERRKTAKTYGAEELI